MYWFYNIEILCTALIHSQKSVHLGWPICLFPVSLRHGGPVRCQSHLPCPCNESEGRPHNSAPNAINLPSCMGKRGRGKSLNEISPTNCTSSPITLFFLSLDLSLCPAWLGPNATRWLERKIIKTAVVSARLLRMRIHRGGWACDRETPASNMIFAAPVHISLALFSLSLSSFLGDHSAIYIYLAQNFQRQPWPWLCNI